MAHWYDLPLEVQHQILFILCEYWDETNEENLDYEDPENVEYAQQHPVSKPTGPTS
jgi:hypothetical protein